MRQLAFLTVVTALLSASGLLGQMWYQMPNCQGQTVNEARLHLSKVPVTWGVYGHDSVTNWTGGSPLFYVNESTKVIGQWPAAGTPMVHGTTVRLLVPWTPPHLKNFRPIPAPLTQWRGAFGSHHHSSWQSTAHPKPSAMVRPASHPVYYRLPAKHNTTEDYRGYLRTLKHR